MSPGQLFQAHIQQGGLFEAPAGQQAQLNELAQASGLTVMMAECDRARSRSAVLRAVAKAVDYPEFFGNDLEALYDCLTRSEEHTSELQSRGHLVCRLLLERKNK